MSAKHDVSKRPKGLFHVVLEEAQVGDEVVYHIGEFAGGPHKKDAFTTYENGHCFLYQRKIGQALFEYTARKRAKK